MPGRLPGRTGHARRTTRTTPFPRNGAARTRTPTSGRPNWKNGRVVDQRTFRTARATSIGGPNRKNRRAVDQKALRAGLATTVGGSNWKNGRAVDQNGFPMGRATARGGELAPTLPFQWRWKTRERTGRRPLFPSDGGWKTRNRADWRPRLPSGGAANAATGHLAQRGTVGWGQSVGWRQSVERGVAGTKQGETGRLATRGEAVGAREWDERRTGLTADGVSGVRSCRDWRPPSTHP